MADWNTPSLTSTYTSVLDAFKNRDIDAALMFDPAVTTPTNLPTNSIRWNSATNRFEKFNGTAWGALTTSYLIDVDTLDGQHGSYYLAWANFTGVPATFPPSAHTHDDRYYTEIEADARYGNNLFVSGNTIQLRTPGNTALTTITVPFATNAGTVGGFSVDQNLLTTSSAAFATVALTAAANADTILSIIKSGSTESRLKTIANALVFSVAAVGAEAERMRLDNASNLTPPTTNTGSLGTSALRWGSVISAAFSDGTNTLLNSSGTVAQVAPGATLTAVAFNPGGTERARITSAGAMGLGTNNPSASLHISRAQNEAIRIQNTTAGGASSFISFYETAGTRLAFIGNSSAATPDLFNIWSESATASIRLGTNGAERLRIDADGDVGIGTASPGFILDVQGATAAKSTINVLRTGSSGVGAQLLSTGALAGVAATAAGPLALYTSDLERLYITAAGNVGIGTNTPADQLHLSSAAPNFRLTDTDTGGYTQLSAANSTGSFGIYVDQGNTVASSIFLLYIDGAEKMRVDASGNLTATGNVTAYSDARLKSDIRTISGALDLVQNMRGVFFRKDGATGVGVIAQEMEQVLPEVVVEGDYKSVAYGNLVGVLIEAIKELRSEVYALKGV